MTETQYLKVNCEHCQNHIAYPVERAGTQIPCPHCNQLTNLPLPVSNSPKPNPWRKFILGLILISMIVDPVILFALRGRLFPHKVTNNISLSNSLPETNSTLASITNITDTNLSLAVAETITNQPVATVPKVKSLSDLSAGKISIEKKSGSHLVYAVGKMKNNSSFQHFGVRVELDLLDQQGIKIGSTQDYIGILEPRKTWVFRAIVTDPKTVTVILNKITEEN